MNDPNDPEQPNDSRFPLTRNSVNTSFSSAPSGTPPPSSPRTARPRTWKTYLGVPVLAFICLVTMVGGLVIAKIYKTPFGKAYLDTTFKNPGGVLQGDILGAFDYKKVLPADKQHAVNILIMGCDHDYDDRTQQPIMTTPGRSDSMIMARIDFDKNTINCLSIPRDSAVRIAGHKGLHKINAAHEFGDNALAMQTVKDRLGIQTDYYFSLDFEGFQKVVDAIGGVTVVVHKKLDYDDNWGNLHVHLKPGEQHLNGYKAMGYVRIRHSDSDEMRSERQHEFIEALRQQIMNPMNAGKLPDLLNTVTKHIKSNMTNDQMLAVAHYVRNLDKKSISLSTLPNEEGRSYCYIPQDKAHKVIADLFFYGDEKQVQMDLPEAKEVWDLNHGRIVKNDAGESVGDAVFGGTTRKKRREHKDTSDSSSHSDRTMSTDTPIRPPDENAIDGKRSSEQTTESNTKDTPKESPKDKPASSGTDKTESKSGATDTF